MTTVFKLNGTGESQTGRNMLSPVPGEDFRYVAEIRPIGLRTYAESVADARRRLRELDAAGEDYVLTGYSLGAAAAGDFVQHDRPKHCRGVVLLSDPKRHRRQCSNPGVHGGTWGVAGERFIDHVPCFTFTIPDDPISACPGNNGMRQIASRVTGLPQDPGQWWNAGYTLQWLWKYLADGRHTAYGVERVGGVTYLDLVKRAVEGLV
ncbi:hypothetical protein [Mycolicibacter arupensis]|uniref:hypothetical protein n=1 Tax=Mycolicibacter arupensis TaxID=342002 RepID=UPI003B3B1EE0